ncbi:hypothetical protein CAP35_12805 [Chitinophagaceae bacterium IBVUCB1]|nr:hypothetical protein CAP35_12805 [Chitinophagaceae bacterium IBVUCB1]
MSHDTHQQATCPNCGFHTSHNYCAQCGQETHLHKDSFWGLVTHFTGHYFHYHSKFWQTLKALWLRPGSLSLAYKNKQRARYVPPISLYIFVSILYFVIYSYTEGSYDKADVAAYMKEERVKTTAKKPANTVEQPVLQKLEQVLNDDDKMYELFKKVEKALPKFFFFMMPILGLMLWLLFAAKQGMNYADHIIFAIHVHSFGFTLFLLNLFPLPAILVTIIEWGMFIYLILAIRNFYQANWIKAIIYSGIITASYVILFFTLMTCLLILFATM